MLNAVTDWITSHKIPLGMWMSDLVDWIRTHCTGVLDIISNSITWGVDSFTALLQSVPPILLIIIFVAGTAALKRRVLVPALVGVGLTFILNQGYWDDTMATLSLILFSTLTSMAIGVPLGIAAAHRPWLDKVLHPLLDLMQTLPTFVYLIPTLILFGLGTVPGLISTIIFAVPAPIRMTQMGISSVSKTFLEAGESFGATPRQLLWKIELPAALPMIRAGLTQCIMLSLSMVVIAALVGAGGLGVPVVRALNSVQVDIGFEAGFAIVILAIILDRVCRAGDSGK
ncbi:choline ABC transporter permease subunit [Acetobacter sp. TBRC 12305]|uniref:Choline ABC transporter permease subunit n=1 Tax=Acetobacter garciniae TaxID=2817435 RepID=A0A939KP94_9PROT|nr:choline ABC transporter permease subunit [Acetobacter garciniae]MBO1326590.1 choline ABC transporter permease subunit [Acetobacter garciniae]MBX0346227.1 choline ABC transporter permease subunit [Acetobacter garciniae]